MASVREQIADAIETALEAATAGGTTKPTGLAVHRLYTRPLEEDELPAILFFFENEATSEVEGDLEGAVEETLRFRAELRAAVPAATPPDTALDALYIWCVKALKASAALTGTLALSIKKIATTWNMEERHASFAAAQVVFAVTYQTADDDPEESRV